MGSCATQNGMLSSNYKIFEMNQSVKNLENAHQAFRVGRLSDAEEICREILGNDEQCAGAWHLMGKMAALQSDLEAAGEFSSAACDLDPQNAEFTRDFSEVFLRKKELEPAEQKVQRAQQVKLVQLAQRAQLVKQV